VRHDRLPISDAVVVAQGERILFAIPWGERVILGTTDTDYEGKVEDVGVDEADVRYILDVVNAGFPKAKLTDQDITSQWAGVRPLISEGKKKGGPSNISRKHVIRMGEPGWIDVAGGKLTTYRHIAEQAVDQAVNFLEIEVPKSTTAREALVSEEEAEGISGLLPPEVSQNVVEHFCRNEWARHLDDVMIRRTSWKYYMDDVEGLARKVAGWMGEIFRWDAARTSSEMERFRAVRN